MKTYTSSEARKNLFTLLDEVIESKEAVVINKRGQESVVLLPFNEYNAMKRKKVRDLKIFGIWKDRKDMKDSVKWVNENRKLIDARKR